jgi:uncharacterized protein DUF1573
MSSLSSDPRIRSRPRAALRAIGLAAAACLTGVSAAMAGPRADVPERVFDFGAVDRGVPVAHVFRIANPGDADLRIEQVKSSCGCTVAVVSARDIAPGGEGRVEVTLDTARIAGPTTKVVSVYTNDPEQGVLGLSLTGEVRSDLVTTPSPLYLGRVHRGEPVRREVTIVPGGTPPSTVTHVEQTSAYLRTTLEARPDGPGQRLVVELDGDVPLGRLSESIRLFTTSPREPIMTLTVLGSVEGDVAVLPPQVTFGVARPGDAPERELVIRSRRGRPLTVTRVAVPEDVVSYRLSTTQEGIEYRLALRLRDGLRPGKVEATVEIFTDHPGEERLVVPLYAIVRGGRG